MWASKHDNREVESAGLSMCSELIKNIAETDLETSSEFFKRYFISILQDVFFVLTDTDHKAGEGLDSNVALSDKLLTNGRRLQTPVAVTLSDVQLRRVR